MFVALRARPGTAIATSEVVTAGEQLEEEPVIFGDGVGVGEDGGPPVEGVEDCFFRQR